MITKECQDFNCNLVAHSADRKAHFTPQPALLLYPQNYREIVITTTPHCKESYCFLRPALQSSEPESTSFNLATGRFRDRKGNTNSAFHISLGNKPTKVLPSPGILWKKVKSAFLTGDTNV